MNRLFSPNSTCTFNGQSPPSDDSETRRVGRVREAHAQSASNDSQIGKILESYLQSLERGDSPNIDDLLTQHADLADQLEPSLRKLAALHQISNRLQSPETTDPLADLIGQDGTLGDYRIIRELGRGGMGIVYEAQQISLARRVALKVLPFAAVLDPRHLQRFKNEALAAASLDHPNIVEVYGVGCERGVHFYAMRYVEGQTLAAVIEGMRNDECGMRNESVGNALSQPAVAGGVPELKTDVASSPHSPFAIRQSPLTDTAGVAALSTLRTKKPKDYYRQIAALGIQAAEALDHAHQMGIVHRDIKPSNLILESVVSGQLSVVSDRQRTTDEGLRTTPRLYITDFGLARIETGATLTMTGDLLGTLRYMSPEQALAKRITVDHRTDIYSLGITLYELLALQPAFNGSDREEVLRQIAFEDPTPLRRLKPAIPIELETIIHKTISKNPDDRYATACDLADDLTRFLEHRHIRARRPSLARRARAAIRRHRGVAVLSVFLVLIAAGLVSVEAWRRATARRDVELQTRNWITAARIFIDSGRLDQAAERIAAANDVLGESVNTSTSLHAELNTLRDEIEARRGDQRRFNEFVELAQYAQEEMEPSTTPGTDVTAMRALELYGALSNDGWLNAVSQSRLSPEQQATVREIAYVTLVSLADYRNRQARSKEYEGTFPNLYKTDEGTLRLLKKEHDRAIELLARAAAVQLPTRAWYLVRRECYLALGNHTAADEDLQHSQTAIAVTASDFYLMGHTARDRAESIGCYEAALRLQPDHYNSLYSLARSLQDSGQPGEAAGLFAACIALRPDHFAPYINRARCLARMDRLEAADGAYAAALAAAQRIERNPYGREHNSRLVLHGRIAVSQRLGRIDSVQRDRELIIATHQRSLQEQEAKYAPDHPNTLAAMNTLAIAHFNAGRPQDAIAICQDALHRLGIDFSPEHPHPMAWQQIRSAFRFVRVVGELARDVMRDEMGPFVEQMLAARFISTELSLGPGEEPLVRGENIFGEEPIASTLMQNMSVYYSSLGKPETGLTYADLAYHIRAKILGKDDPDTMIAAQNLLTNRRMAKDCETAIPLARELLKLQSEKLGPASRDTLRTVLELAHLYCDAGQTDKAAAHLYEFLPLLLRSISAPTTPNAATATQQVELAEALLKTGFVAEAESQLRQALAMRRELTPAWWHTFHAMSLLGESLARQEQYGDAEPLLVLGYGGLVERESQMMPGQRWRIATARDWLVEFYEATEQPQRAEFWREKLKHNTR